MHQHDTELIMSLADGSLDPAAIDGARAEILACAECSYDLQMQTEALSSLQAMPEAALTEMESARLRRTIRSELGITEKEQLAAAPKRRRLPLAALGTAAAVLVAVVVVGPALNLLGGDSAADTTTAEILAEAAPTTAAASRDTNDDQNAGDAPNAAGNTEEGSPQATDTTAAPTTAAAATSTTFAVPPSNQDRYAYFSQSPDLGELFDSAAQNGFDEDASRSEVLRASTASILEEQPDQSAACIVVTQGIEENFVAGFQIARGLLDGREVIYVVYLAEEASESVLIAHAADNCEELARSS